MNNKYLQFYKYTDNNEQIINFASNIKFILKKDYSERNAIGIIGRYLRIVCFDYTITPPRAYYPAKTLLDSRYKKATKLIIEPMASCGAQATLAASILRNLNFKIKLIHGDYPNSDKHAWNEIWLKNEKKWLPFDLSSGIGTHFTIDPKKHTKQLECADWSEISDVLEKESMIIQKRKGLDKDI